MSIRVVTDSSCDLPQGLVDALRIEIVPLTIRFGSEEFVDREELSTEEFWRRLETSKVLPETAAPSAGAFEQKFRDLVGRGATGIICINLSSHLSATMQSAQVAAAAVSKDVPVQVIDSRSASMGLGNLVLTAAQVAAELDQSPKAATAALTALVSAGILTVHGPDPRATRGRPPQLYVSEELLGLAGATPRR